MSDRRRTEEVAHQAHFDVNAMLQIFLDLGDNPKINRSTLEYSRVLSSLEAQLAFVAACASLASLAEAYAPGGLAAYLEARHAEVQSSYMEHRHD